MALARDNTINLCNLKGKILKTVDSTNVTVLDGNRVDTSAFTKKLMFTSKGDIVFYDKTAKSLRIIKKNNAANNSTKSTSQK